MIINIDASSIKISYTISNMFKNSIAEYHVFKGVKVSFWSLTIKSHTTIHCIGSCYSLMGVLSWVNKNRTCSSKNRKSIFGGQCWCCSGLPPVTSGKTAPMRFHFTVPWLHGKGHGTACHDNYVTDLTNSTFLIDLWRYVYYHENIQQYKVVFMTGLFLGNRWHGPVCSTPYLCFSFIQTVVNRMSSSLWSSPSLRSLTTFWI